MQIDGLQAHFVPVSGMDFAVRRCQLWDFLMPTTPLAGLYALKKVLLNVCDCFSHVTGASQL
jgi:hypothetical protein